LAGRHALVCAIEDGLSLKAAAFTVSSATARRWWRALAVPRRRGAAGALVSVGSLHCARRSRCQLAPELAGVICACRRATGWGPRRVACATGFAHSTVWKVLHRADLKTCQTAEGTDQGERATVLGRREDLELFSSVFRCRRDRRGRELARVGELESAVGGGEGLAGPVAI